MTFRSDNRAAMPEVAKIVDEFRAEFGKVRVEYALEKNEERGRKWDSDSAVTPRRLTDSIKNDITGCG